MMLRRIGTLCHIMTTFHFHICQWRRHDKRTGISLLLSCPLPSTSLTAYIFPRTEWAHLSLNGNIVFAVHFRTRKCLPQPLVQQGLSQAAQCSGKCQSSLFRGNTHDTNNVSGLSTLLPVPRLWLLFQLEWCFEEVVLMLFVDLRSERFGLKDYVVRALWRFFFFLTSREQILNRTRFCHQEIVL